jgi:glycosyltransferase involved in cell wall biosynthesis
MAPSQLAGIEDYDVVHLHYINFGFDEATLFRRLNPQQRLFWTLHDAYPFTGGCHIARDCERYAIGCGRCPRLGGKRDDDLSAQIVRRKLDRLRGFDMTFIGPSRWIVGCCERSVIGKVVKLGTIPDSVDTALFVPTGRHAAKASLGVPADRVTVGWLAAAVDDPNKGLDLLQAAMQGLDPDRFHVLWGGNGDFELQVPCTHTRLKPRIGLAQVLEFYAACDVMVVPSRQETFCLVACEAASCGTPVVAFAATGLLDALSDGENGFLVEPFSTDALRNEIARIAAMPTADYEALREQVRTASVAKYDPELRAQRHIDVYQGKSPR